MSDLELLRPFVVFARVAEEESFRGAARQLGLSPSYVSQMITDLEARLGQQLLYRSTRQLTLTSAGERFLVHAAQIAQAFEAGMAESRGETPRLQGRLRIAAPTNLAAPVFAKALDSFARAHPDLSLEIWMDDAVIDPIAAGIDVTIRIGEPGNDPRPARKLFDTHGVICTAPELVHELQVPEDLSKWTGLFSPASKAESRLQHIGTGEWRSVRYAHSIQCNNTPLIREVLRHGHSFVMLPLFAIRQAFREGWLAHALPDWRSQTVGVYALYTARRAHLSSAGHFVDHLSAVIDDQAR